MAEPRQIFKGTTYLITRRCTQRKYLIRPSEEVNQTLLFCMIYAANRYKIDIHAYSFLSTHYHLVLTDPHCNLPAFMAWLNQFSAKCLNSMYGRWENLWANGTYSAVSLREELQENNNDNSNDNDVLDKIIYTLSNPVEAGLVDRGYKWPGEWSPPKLMSSGCIKAKRPEFFRKMEKIPKKVKMKLTIPPGFSHLSPEEFTYLVAEKLKQKEDEIQAVFKAQGREFMGAEKIKAQNPESRPRKPEPRRKLNPTIACRDKRKRIQLLERLEQFRVDYKKALEWFRAGKRDVIFPPGTYKMREFYNVRCDQRQYTVPIPT